MNAWMLLRIALKALVRNKVRTLLTMLGIIIGVAAVIAMVSLGEGARRQVQNEISSMGTNILFVQSGSFRGFGVHGGAGTSASLTEEDYLAILREIAAVKAATPDVNTRGQVVFGNQNWNTQLEGVNEYFLTIRSWMISAGENFNESHIQNASRVCILGKTVADNLFQGGESLGQSIRIRNLPFQVIGVLQSKGQNAFGRDQDDLILVPYTTVMKKLQQTRNIPSILVSAISAEAAYTAEAEIRELLRQRLRLGDEEEDTFTVRNLSEVAGAAEETNRIMTLLLGSIAAVSLLVGGIGIMNIMLVAVTERTREIGLRLAIGAHAVLIRIQFLLEAVVLSLTGGAIGIALGIGASHLISRILQWPTAVSPASVLLSVLTSVAIGIFFGFYPAHKASSLNPIEALRHE
ncbi:MAG: ABC transporter permease [Acidobacteria bacterium]|nr:ABC transporter permease [Acidobacteriota bacterium]